MSLFPQFVLILQVVPSKEKLNFPTKNKYKLKKMLPTKGYFQDIECPFFDTTCGRPYCHFRHKRKPNEIVEEPGEKVVPTYKPTPKSELAKNHIPISYVPDLAYSRERSARPARSEKPTYKPTPLSILSSVNNPTNENHEHRETIKDIQDNIASNVYDPFKSEINFEDLSTEFELIDGIINESAEEVINDNIEQLNSDIEKEQNKLNLLKSEIKSEDDNKGPTKLNLLKSDENKDIKKEKVSSRDKSSKHKSSHDKKEKNKEKTSDNKSSSKDEKDSKKTSSKSHKSSEGEKHKKEDKKNSDKHKSSKSRSQDKKQNGKSPAENKKNINSNSSHSSPERHRKKTDNSESKKSSSSSKKEKSDSPSREKQSKSKSKKRSRSRSREQEKKRNKPEPERQKSSKSKKDKRKKSTSESVSDHDNNEPPAQEIILSEAELDFEEEDDDETMRECYKIFNEYKPEASEPQLKTDHKDLFQEESKALQSKKRKAHAGAEAAAIYSKPSVAPPKPSLLPGQILKNRYKIAKLAQASNEQENIINEIKSITTPKPKSLLEAARQYKMKRLEQEKALEQKRPKTNNVVDDILNGTHRPSGSGVRPIKIAAVPNVALIEKAKQRISLVKQQRIENVKTIAQSQKSGRVAHVPEYSLSDIPDVFQADKSKLPVNVRTRFLTMLADECAKIYASKEDIYNRALNEEFSCYEKCKVLATYRNSAMLAVNRLRKEHQDRESKGLGLLLTGETLLNKKETDFQGLTFYNHVKKWLLTEEDLDLHGYPKESDEKGQAIINNRVTVEDYSVDENQRRCSRCGKIYQVDDDGWPLFEDECMYHPLRKRTIRREQVFLCCKSSEDTGCVMSDTHVSDGLEKHLLEGYQTTLPPSSDNDPRSIQVYALDCEMCYTTKGLELTRVTIVDIDCKTIYESFVKPLNPIIDYNTRFSGITKDQMDRTSTSILQVQANILHLCNSETILVGHSLESDMKALKIVHGTIIDTSILFPHKMGLPHKRSLKALASEHLQKIIQNDVAGHDSAEDAVSCMELIKWKLKEELKVKSKGR